jgi:hypothetical protein
MTEQESKKRISYVKPEALDLGSVAPIMGDGVGSCVAGTNVLEGTCDPIGNGPTEVCHTGNVYTD